MDMIRSLRRSSVFSRRPKTSLMISRKAAIITTTTGARWMRKSRKVSFALEAIMILGGSPIRVAVPPMFEARASVMRKGTQSTWSASAISSVTGASSRTVVTLSSRAESTAVITAKMSMIRTGSPRPILALRMAMYSNRPVGRMRLMMIIMPTSRKMTFQSTPYSSIWNASC